MVCFVLKQLISTQIHNLKDTRVSYAHIGYNEGMLYLDEICFSHSRSKEEKLYIEKLECFFSFKIFPWTCHTSYKLVKPSIHLSDGQQPLDWHKISIHEVLSLPPITKKLVIEKGKISCSKVPTAVYFSFKPKMEGKQVGEIQVGFDEEEAHHIDIALYENAEEVSMQMHFHAVPLNLLTKLRKWKEPQEGIIIEQGEFSGVFQVAVTSNNSLQSFKSDVEAKNITITHQNKNSFFKAKECKFHSYLPLDRQNTFQVKEISFPFLMHYLVSTIKLKEGNAYFNNPHTHAVWQLEELEGIATCNLEQTPIVQLKGNLAKDGQSYPIILDGKGGLESEKNWWMDVDICRTHLKDAYHTSLYMQFLDTQEYFIKTHFEKLGVGQLHMLQDLMMVWFPSLGGFHLLEGSLSTDITMVIQNKKIKNLSFQELKCTQLKGKWRDKEMIFASSEIRGGVTLHFPLFNGKESSSWEVFFEGLTLAGKDGKVLLQSSGLLAAEDWKMEGSWIKTTLDGIEGVFTLSGLYSQLEVKGSWTLHEKHCFSPFQEEVLAIDSRLKRLEKVNCAFTVNYENNAANIVGNTELNFAGDLIDHIRFGMGVSFKEFFKEMTLVGGWFQSEKISENTYVWPIKYYKQKWHALGNMQVRGEFDHQALRFVLKSSQAVYESDDIIVTMDSGGSGYLYQGDFAFDFSKKQWDIYLPMAYAHVQDKRLHLPFKEVIAEIYIQGMQLRAEEMSATCENVRFTGRLDLDFTDPDWIDLKLYPKTIEGEATDFIRFMHYMPDFSAFNLPLQGKIEGEAGNTLFIKYNLEESEKIAKIAFKVQEAHAQLNDHLAVKELNFDVSWDSENDSLEIKEMTGELLLHNAVESRHYHLNAQNLISKNLSAGQWDFDLRLEAPTFDILRMEGSTKKIGEDFQIILHPQLTHFFGAKLNITNFLISSQWEILTLNIKSEISSVNLLNQIQWGYLCGWLDFDSVSFQEIKNMKAEGAMLVALSYDRRQQGMNIAIESPSITFDKCQLKDLSVKVFANEHLFLLKEFKTKDLGIDLAANKVEGGWKLSSLTMQWKNCWMTAKKGMYNDHSLQLEVEQLSLNLGELQHFCALGQEYHQLLQGTLHTQGKIYINCSEGFKKWKLSSEMIAFSEAITEGQLQMSFKSPCKVSYSYEEGIDLENLHAILKKEKLEEVWTRVECRHLKISPFEKTSIGKGVKVVISPEMLLYLGSHHLLPYIEIKEKTFSLFGTAFTWDNEIDTDLDFAYTDQSLQIKGILKDGYYWVGEKSLYLQKMQYFLDGSQLNLVFGCDYHDVSLDFLTKVQLKEGLEAKVSIKEGHGEEQDARTSLDIACRYSNDEGFYLQSLEGTLYGVDFSFRRNPRTYLPYVMILTGQMKIDTAGLVRAFPKFFYQTIKDLGMGSGYELSGDWVFSKQDIQSSYFKGFLKGRDFEFLGFYFKTLLSEVEITSRSIAIHDFRLSDMSGVAHIKEAKVQKNEEGSWKLILPEIVVQDFRPSFLKKCEGQEERIKPFVIKDLYFFNIEGILGRKDSFSGKGYLDFINTFKRETNLLDIPIEIMGRIGFDLGLFVPVIGKLDFEMAEGKIFLKELKNTYSEGKRSRFYLSGHKDSYISLDGTLFIDIKMKQYVLLKITEPFTLSIRGSLLKPKYSLR
jgi:hypothetical protein